MNTFDQFKRHIYKLSEMFSAREIVRAKLNFPSFTRDNEEYRREQTQTLLMLKDMDYAIDDQTRLFVKFCGEHIEDRDLLLQIKLKGAEEYDDVDYCGDIFNITFHWVSIPKWSFNPELGTSQTMPIPKHGSIGEWCGIYI